MPTDSAPPVVLVTGAAGNIGSHFAEHAAKRYRLKLMALPGDPKLDALRAFGDVVDADLDDLPRLKEVFAGVDVCLHLAGNPSPSAVWNDLLSTNIVGTYNVYAAAKATGCRRVVYASSIHAVSGYAVDVQVKTSEPVNPGDIYGVSKCFGEALAKYMAEQEGVGGVAIRIGGYQPPERIASDKGLWAVDAWVSPRDLNQLICLAIDRTDVKFAIVHGSSDNRFKRLDISDARTVLGYEPQDDAFVTHAPLRATNVSDMAFEHSLHDADDPVSKSGMREQSKMP